MDTDADHPDGQFAVTIPDPEKLAAALDDAVANEPQTVADARALIADPVISQAAGELDRIFAWQLALTDLQARRAPSDGRAFA